MRGDIEMARAYDFKAQFYMSRESKKRFDYILDRKEVDFSTKLRELINDYIIENEHLLPDELKFKTESLE